MGVDSFNNLLALTGLQITGSNSTGDKVTLPIPVAKVQVLRSELIISGTEATALVVQYDSQPTIGSATGRGTADIGDITVTAVNNQGKVFYDRVAQGTVLLAGSGVVCEVTTASSAAKNFYPNIIVEVIPEVPENVAAMTETA